MVSVLSGVVVVSFWGMVGLELTAANNFISFLVEMSFMYFSLKVVGTCSSRFLSFIDLYIYSTFEIIDRLIFKLLSRMFIISTRPFMVISSWVLVWVTGISLSAY